MVKKFLSIVLAVLLAMLSLPAFIGCSVFSNDDHYKNTLSEFTLALESRNQEKLYDLFSKEIQNDDDLRTKVDELFRFYLKDTTELFFDEKKEVTTKREKSKDGQFSTADISVTVISDEEYYWIELSIVYDCSFNTQEKTGISKLVFYSADEYCMKLKGKAETETPRGFVFKTDKKADFQIRIIDGNPLAFEDTARIFDMEELEAYFIKPKSYKTFSEIYGKPNAVDALSEYYHYYELPKENNEERYLCICAEEATGGAVEYAYIANQKGPVRVLWSFSDPLDVLGALLS